MELQSLWQVWSVISALFQSCCVFPRVVFHQPKLVHPKQPRDKNSKSHSAWFGVFRPCIIDGFLQPPLCPGDSLGVIYYLVAHAGAPPSIKETKDKGISLSGEWFSYLLFLEDCREQWDQRHLAGVVSESNAADSLGI